MAKSSEEFNKTNDLSSLFLSLPPSLSLFLQHFLSPISLSFCFPELYLSNLNGISRLTWITATGHKILFFFHDFLGLNVCSLHVSCFHCCKNNWFLRICWRLWNEKQFSTNTHQLFLYNRYNIAVLLCSRLEVANKISLVFRPEPRKFSLMSWKSNLMFVGHNSNWKFSLIFTWLAFKINSIPDKITKQINCGRHSSFIIKAIQSTARYFSSTLFSHYLAWHIKNIKIYFFCVIQSWIVIILCLLLLHIIISCNHFLM